jgi:hypothetical protein
MRRRCSLRSSTVTRRGRGTCTRPYTPSFQPVRRLPCRRPATSQPPEPTNSHQRLRNFTRSIPGGALALAGTLIALGGGAVLATFGIDGRLASGPRRRSTPTSATVSSVASIKNTSGVSAIVGQPTLRISAAPVPGTAAAFVGIGRAADVNRYLAGVSTEQVTDLSLEPYSISETSHLGQSKPPAPATQRFWTVQSTSTKMADVNWKIRDGQYRVVVMSANGHTGFTTSSAIEIRIPDDRRLGARDASPRTAYGRRWHHTADPSQRQIPKGYEYHPPPSEPGDAVTLGRISMTRASPSWAPLETQGSNYRFGALRGTCCIQQVAGSERVAESPHELTTTTTTTKELPCTAHLSTGS